MSRLAAGIRRPRQWVSVLAAAGLCVFTAAWLALIWRLERASTPSRIAAPACAGVTDPAWLGPIDRARGHARAMLDERGIPGLSVAVAIDGRLVWAEGFGYADRETKLPACPDTQFRVASVSKILTAALMARLYEEGRLDFDAPIRKYVPGFPEKAGAITPRLLASHRAGIRHYRDDNEAIAMQGCATTLEAVRRFQDEPLLFTPGEGFAYSSFGYVLLAAALEAASGESYPDALRRHVLEPLGLRNTVEDRIETPTPRRASFYDNVTPYSTDGSLVRSPSLDFSCKWPSGGLLSTSPDLVRFGTAHMPPHNGQFLRKDTLEMLFSPRTRQAGIMGYGLGWMTARDLRLRRVLFHFGAGSGGTAVIALFPGQRVAVALLANLGHAKFPMERLLGIVNPFLPDRTTPILAMVCLGSLAAVLRLGVRPRR